MRVTRLGRDFPLLQSGYGSTTQIPTGGDSGQVPTSNGSNGVYYGPNVATLSANGSNTALGPFVNLNAGTGVGLSVSSNSITITNLGGGGGGGFDLGWFIVTDYGATGDGTTDDTPAIQDTIDACAAAGGGTVYFPPGVYLIDGALQDTGAFNGQLLLPDVDVTTDDPVTIRLLGANPPPISYHGTLPTPGPYSFLKSTLTGATGTAAMLSGGNGSYPGFQNNVQCILENLFAIPEDDDVSFTVFNLAACQGGGVRNVFVVPEPVFFGTVTEPTHSNSYALKLPQCRNSNGTLFDGFGASVMYHGVMMGELAVADRLAFGYCKRAMHFAGTEHLSTIVQMHATGCPSVFYATAAHRVNILSADFETTTGPAWTDIDYHVDDASNFLYGTLFGWSGYPLPPTQVFTKNGGANFNAYITGSALGGAPTTADYLVGTANGSLSAEIVVGTTPGGELGGTWGSPTVDGTHSGSAHTDFIAKAIVDTKGDLIAATAADTVDRVGVGTDGQYLKADSTATAGVSWGTVSASGGQILVSDTPAGSPLVFGDLLQNEAQDDLIYAD